MAESTLTGVRKIANNEKIESDLRKDGIALFDFLNKEDFIQLEKIVKELGAESDPDDVHLCTNFRLSAFNNSYKWKSHIYESIYSFIKPKLNELLLDYEPLVINIFEKPPGAGDTSVAIHQNPSFAEEPKFKSVSLWIPLIDVNRNNGTLGVLKGSHNVFDTIRAANMPDVFIDIATKLQNDWFEPVEISRGQAALLDDSLIHWSYSNNSDENRLAVQLICVPKETRHIYYYYDEKSNPPRINLYDVDKDFFFKFNCKAEPEGLNMFSSYPFSYHNLTEKEIISKVAPRNPSLKLPTSLKSMWSSLFNK